MGILPFQREPVALLHSGSFFGERSILFDQPLEYSYMSLNQRGNEKGNTEITLYSIAKENFLEVCDKNPVFSQFLRKRCMKRDSYWKCYELAKKSVHDVHVAHGRNHLSKEQLELKTKMAQKFFENLNVNEIKALLKSDHDPRFSDQHAKTRISNELQCVIDKNEAN